MRHWWGVEMKRASLRLGVALGTALALGGLTLASAGASSSSRLDAPGPVHLEVPAGLAVAANGELFIADEWLNQIVERLPNGSFRVVAGTGKKGFSGDGGPATKADLDAPTALVRSARGTIYFIDSGGRRVRAILANGVIETIAGGGSLQSNTITSGTRATRVSFYPEDLTLAPDGDLYISDGNQVLKYSDGRLTNVASPANFVGVVATSKGFCAPDAIAFDSSGGLWVGCDASRQLLEQTSSGKYVVVMNHYRPHDFPGLAAGPRDAMIVSVGESLQRFVGSKSTLIMGLSDFSRARTFVPSAVAIATNGAIYTDSQYGDGFTFGAALGEVFPSGRFKFLDFWKVDCATTPACS